MAINRRVNWLGQQRVDLPFLKSIESGVSYDLDVIGYMLAGESPYIVKGFELLGITIGMEAVEINIKTAGSLLIHPLASENGSMFAVPSNRATEVLNPSTNTRMSGSCQPSSTNYIGIDLTRQADTTTSDVVQFLDTLTNIEYGQRVPLARTLDYKFIISQTDFAYNRSVAPVAIVTTDAQNCVVSYQDCRPLLGRLTPGGTVSSSVNPFSWPGGRVESTTSVVAGDKSLTSLKSWQNAVMTRLWELGGGEQWFSPTADRNVRLNTGASVFTSTGESFEIVSSNLHWRGLSYSFDNSTQYSVLVNDQLTSLAGLTDLAAGECIYVDIDRTSGTAVTAQKGQLATLGVASKPGSRWIIASRIGSNYYVTGQPWPIGSSLTLATTTHAGTLKTTLDVSPADPIAATIIPTVGGSQGIIVGAGISHAKTAGTVVLTDGDIKIGQGTTSGDQNVIIKTTGSYGTIIEGTGDWHYPRLAIQTGGGSPYTVHTANCTLLNVDDALVVEGTNAIKHRQINCMPLSPTSSDLKYFAKRTKSWMTSCVACTTSFGGSTWTYNNTNKTLTSDTVGALTVDGVSVASTNRILINVAAFTANGIYTVTTVGDSGTVPVLTRANDAGGPTSPGTLGLGYDLYDGSAVKVTSGTFYTNTYWYIQADNINNAILLDGTQIHIWTATTGVTAMQYCVMWSDGSFTVIATGPNFTVT
jgi:hypothetical protein